jgi:hypothetical protein
LNNKIKIVFSEIEKNIKVSLKDYFDHSQYVEYDLDKKFNTKLENNNAIIESKIENKLKSAVNEIINIQKDNINNNYINNNEYINDEHK